MNFDKIPETNRQEQLLPFDAEYEAERERISKEYNVSPSLVDKREDGLWYVKGRRILPPDTFSGLMEDDDANPYKKRSIN